jgi:hypothetical protein
LLPARSGRNILVLSSVSLKTTGIPTPFINSIIADCIVAVVLTLLRVVVLSIPPTVTVILFATVYLA